MSRFAIAPEAVQDLDDIWELLEFGEKPLDKIAGLGESVFLGRRCLSLSPFPTAAPHQASVEGKRKKGRG